MTALPPLTPNEIEAANRGEATAILIRAGYRVYRPEADVSGEDMVIRTPEGSLRPVQMKGRPTVDHRRYGERGIWMLFPDPTVAKLGRPWFLVEHDQLFAWVKNRHGGAPSWNDTWNYPRMSVDLRKFIQPSMLDTGRPEAATTDTPS